MVNRERTTPYYLIHKKQFEQNCSEIEDSFQKRWGKNVIFGYSVKTNNCRELVSMSKDRGWFAEVVSEDEFNYINGLGFGDGKVICNGPVKGNMLQRALQQGLIVNLDNLQEVAAVCDFVRHNGIKKDKTKIGLRVNFDLESACPGETTAGRSVSRFGINYENGDLGNAIKILREHQICVSGLHMHTSTKSRSLAVFKELSWMARKLADEFRLDLEYIDLGGGLFGGQRAKDRPTMSEYAEVICAELKKGFDSEKVVLILEPGASIIATAVDYVTQVVNVRDICGEKVITLDGTALHINPFMTMRTPHFSVSGVGAKEIDVQHVCGCTCMETDRFVVLNHEKELLEGSLFSFHYAGAYTMSFNSNFIVRPPSVYIDD